MRGSDPVSSTTAGCIRPSNLTCAHSLYARAAGLGLPEGLAGIGSLASDRAALGIFLLNEHLVRAFRVPFDAAVTDAGLESAILGELEAGRAPAPGRCWPSSSSLTASRDSV